MEKLHERLQQLELQRAQLSRSFDQISGGILEIQKHMFLAHLIQIKNQK